MGAIVQVRQNLIQAKLQATDVSAQCFYGDLPPVEQMISPECVVVSTVDSAVAAVATPRK